MRRRQYIVTLGVATAGILAGCSDSDDTSSGEPDLPFEREVDPSRTYLRTNNDDAGDAEPIDIESLGIQSESTLRLIQQGSFTGSSGGTGMTGVFSGSAEFAASDTRERVVEAIDAGDDYETSPTFEGSQPTDISEDFLIADNEGNQTSTTIRVPEGATHLFVAAIDNYYQDNGQGDSPFGVRIESA